MRKMRWVSWLGGVAAVMLFVGAGPASAVTSDRAAAIVDFPAIIAVSGDTGDLPVGNGDTLVQLSNTSNEPVNLHCFYENGNGHCSATGDICYGDIGVIPSDCGTCAVDCNEIDFWVHLTPRQPIAWLASDGMTKFPLDGRSLFGVDGSSNAGSRIPPVPELPFFGSLKCVVVDNYGTPIDKNVIKGEATFVSETDLPSVAKYNGVGIRAIEGAVNDDKELVLGGPDAEYEGCPSVLILNHFFDGTLDPAAPAPAPIYTFLTLVPCQDDLLRQVPGETVVQYLVFNEFEQRFSTSRTVECQQLMPLSMIDTTQTDRSIFFVGVAGTTTGQTRISPLDAGLVGMAVEVHGFEHIAAFNLHFQGSRPDPDMITLP